MGLLKSCVPYDAPRLHQPRWVHLALRWVPLLQHSMIQGERGCMGVGRDVGHRTLDGEPVRRHAAMDGRFAARDRRHGLRGTRCCTTWSHPEKKSNRRNIGDSDKVYKTIVASKKIMTYYVFPLGKL